MYHGMEVEKEEKTRLCIGSEAEVKVLVYILKILRNGKKTNETNKNGDFKWEHDYIHVFPFYFLKYIFNTWMQCLFS